MRVLVSLHDVTPVHLPRLIRAERLFEEIGVTEVGYLLVPDFHAMAPIDRSPAFAAWCHRPRPFTVHWTLHGYYHREFPSDPREAGGVRTWLQRALLTDGEAEFLSLSADASRERLAHGCHAFDAMLHVQPQAFVAPAWLFDPALLIALVESRIRYTEDHRHVYDLERGEMRPCPVITWSTRAAWRRALSAIACERLLRRWAREPVVRVALHPSDLQFESTEAAVRRTLEAALADRTCAAYDDVFTWG